MILKERRVILFTGRVQGVGFRMTAVHLGEDLALVGTVANRDHGQVELDVQGDSQEIDTLVERLREQFGTFVRSISQRTSTPTGQPGQGIRVIH